MTQDILSLSTRRLLDRFDEMARALNLSPELHELLVNEILLEFETLKKAANVCPLRSPLPVTQAAYLRLQELQTL